MATNGHTFGIFTHSQKGVRFTNVTADIVNHDPTGENHPKNPTSPNFPREEKFPGYQNPILGDEGNGKLGRWQEVKFDAVEDLVDQMIELYLKDKSWYAKVRCREALWNMYRKLAWYVRYIVGDDIAKYQQALRMIRDCIYKIEHPEKIEKRKIFHENFNKNGVYSSKITYSPEFAWFDVLSGTGLDGVLKIEGQIGEFTVRLDPIVTTYDGFITFQYGGRMIGSDEVELYDNGAKIWEGKVNKTAYEQETPNISIAPGLHSFLWVYKSTGDTPSPMFWIDVIEVNELKPIYSKYNVGLVDVMNPPVLDHKGFDEDDLTLSGTWETDDTDPTNNLLAEIPYGESQYVQKEVRINGNESYLQFEYSISDEEEPTKGTISVYVDDVPIWVNTSETHGSEFVRIDNLPMGKHTFKIEFKPLGGGTTYVSIKNIEFVEIEDTDKADAKYNEMNVPYCPAPYPHRYNAAYFNDYDGLDNEVEMFNSASLPKMNDFPGFLRYVSSSEEQEWDLVHSVGGPDEQSGNENIFKMDVSKLSHGNNTKVTTLWKFKERGVVKFKFLSSVDKGNGLIFFINDKQVGGEWSKSDGWDEATFNVTPGQTFKFDWIIRKKSTKKWGLNALYLKDIRFAEIVKGFDNTVPGHEGEQESGEWYIRTDESSIIGAQSGERVDPTKTHEVTLCGECDGEISFSYTMDEEDPGLDDDVNLILSDAFKPVNQSVTGNWGKDEWSGGPYDWNNANTERPSSWSYLGDHAYTEQSTSLEYGMHVFNDYLLDRNSLEVKGKVRIDCPVRYIHHYDTEEYIGTAWLTGNQMWSERDDGNGISATGAFGPGVDTATTYVESDYGGEVEFYISKNTNEGDKLEVKLNDSTVFSTTSATYYNWLRFNAPAGNNKIDFILTATGKGPTKITIDKGTAFKSAFNYNYGIAPPNGAISVPVVINDGEGSSAEVARNQWIDGNGKRSYTTNSSGDYSIDINLAPGTTFGLEENVRFLSGDISGQDPSTAVFGEGNTSNFTCYAGGSKEVPIDYKYLTKSVKTKLNEDFKWNDNVSGATKGKTPTYHIGTTDKMKFVRQTSASSVGDVTFTETLKVVRGKAQGLPLDLQYFADYGSDSWYTIPGSTISHNMGGTRKGQSKTSWSNEFYSSSGDMIIDISFSGDMFNADQGIRLGKTEVYLYRGSTKVEYLAFAVDADNVVVRNTLTDLPAGYYKIKMYTLALESSSHNGYMNMNYAKVRTNREGSGPPSGGGGGGTVVLPSPCDGVNPALGNAGSKDPKIYPGYPVKRCMKGSYVREIQEKLGITADGIFGAQTEAAVKAWQKKHGLKADGLVGPMTWGEMFPPPTPIPPKPPTDYTKWPGSTLEHGDRGNYVKEAQKRLLQRGCPPGPIDGIFGDKTRDAIKEFQELYGLPVTGKLDKATWDKLFSDDKPNYFLDDTRVRVIVKDMKTGALISDKWYHPTGGQVEAEFNISVKVPKGKDYEIQYILYKGKGTKDGILGKGGGMWLKEGKWTTTFDPYCKAKGENEPYSAKYPGLVESGDKSASVKAIQLKLIGHGYVLPKFGADGEFGSETVTAVKQFQKDHGLPETGKVDEATWDELFGDAPTTPLSCNPYANLVVKGPGNTTVYSQNFSGKGGHIDFAITNNATTTKNYTMTFTFNKDCTTDVAELNSGVIYFARPDQTTVTTTPNSIDTDITEFKFTERIPHWTGGCDIYNMNNSFTVKLVGDDGYEYAQRIFTGSGEYEFEFTEIKPSPVQDYKLVIETVQGGEYDELHPGTSVFNPYRFYVDTVEIYERFVRIPDPFNSVLDFYMDGELRTTYEPSTLGVFKDKTYRIKKGCHDYKWEIRQKDDRFIFPWDRAKIDWLELTNWICDEIMITPYCEPGGGDKCIEALIKCVLPIVKDPSTPIVCKIGKKVWLFT